MHLIETTPCPCCVCGRGNAENGHGDRPRFVDFERDINWNDPLIMCEDCIAHAGGMVGMASKDMLSTAKAELIKKEKELHDAQVAMETMQRRARKLGVEFTGQKVTA